MARARYLKPGFFKNEELAELRPPKTVTDVPAAAFAARLCFEGLWVLADRLGRLEDRPKRIKAELFPYDRLDVEPLLSVLAAGGFIRRYLVAGERYISVVAFPKHQHPHQREPASTIPAPPPMTSKPAQRRNGASTGPAPGSHRASTGRAPGRHDPGRAESESESESELRTNTQPARSVQAGAVERVLATAKRKYQRSARQGAKTHGRFR